MAKEKETKKLTDFEIRSKMEALSKRVIENTQKKLDLFDPKQLGDEDLDKKFDAKILSAAADPDLSHRLYYGMRRLMTDNLPHTSKNKDKSKLTPEQIKKDTDIKKMKRMIYDEKSLFLNRGKSKNIFGIKHSDERQAYIDTALRTAFEITYKWVRNGANPFDLFDAFYQLNEESGYHKG